MTTPSIAFRCVVIFLGSSIPQIARLSGQTVNKPDLLAFMHGLQDVEHRLTSAIVNGGQLSIPDNPAITINFHSGGIVSGNSGVNRYFGGMEIMPTGTFRWEPPDFATTKMAGEADLMEFEATFLKALRTADALQLVDDGVEMFQHTG